jgi:hypothetical protein
VGQWSQFLIFDKPYKNILNVGDRSVSQELRRLRDRLRDDRNAQNLFKRGSLENVTIDELTL